MYWCWDDLGNEDYELAEHQIPETSYVDNKGLEPEMTVYYKVAAYSNGKFFRESPMSKAVSATTLAENAAPIEENIPDPPDNVTATASSPTSILVTWNVRDGATGYNVYSSYYTDGDYTYRAFVGTGLSPGWIDNECDPGQTRYYRVTALSADGESEKSAPVFATTVTVSNVPDTPTNVSATASGTTITITWTAVSNATSYYVYRADQEAGSYMSCGNAYSSSYTDMGLSENTTYYYKVTAYNSYGESAQSSYVSAQTGTNGGSGGGGGGGGAAGSSAATAITLFASPAMWTDGALNNDSPAVWYSFHIPDNGVYCLMGRDVYGYGPPYTGDVSFQIYDSGLNLIKTIDAGNGGNFDSPGGINDFNYIKGTWTPGTWYVKVVPYNGNYTTYGTYAIYFY